MFPTTLPSNLYTMCNSTVWNMWLFDTETREHLRHIKSVVSRGIASGYQVRFSCFDSFANGGVIGILMACNGDMENYSLCS